MKFRKAVLASAVALTALQANANITTMLSDPTPPPGYIYTAPTSFSGNATVETVSNGMHLQPGNFCCSYLSVQPMGSATITFDGPSYSFLWGSPDPTNVIDLDNGLFTATGFQVFGPILANSSNDNTRYVTLQGLADGAHSLMLTTGQIAFEMSVLTPVPEPQTYALMLGGLGALVFMSRRRKI
jgi:hypothetical protein